MHSKNFLLLLLILTVIPVSAGLPAVKPGVEVLRDGGFAPLHGKRIGLITNPTGVDSNLKSTIDIINEAEDVELVALFAPEHGVRGDIPAGQKLTDARDEKTGIKVHSLYGSTRRPTAAMLADIDALVYDIQDNGCRSYTFISTMGMAMEECARQGKEFIVLDRPNPLGGNRVEGPVADADCLSFVCRYPIPYLYGLTPGELATLLVGEGMIKLDKPLKLTIVPMEGWDRGMLYADTGLPWVLPSPHQPTAESALLYPATGIAGELEYLSIGVGYTLPFRTFAAPWINAEKFADRLNTLELPGIAFRPIHYKPYYGFGKATDLHGVEVFVTDTDRAELTPLQFIVMQELAAMYPAHKAGASNPARFDMFDKVIGTRKIRPIFFKSYKWEDIKPLWNNGTDEFKTLKKKYEIY